MMSISNRILSVMVDKYVFMGNMDQPHDVLIGDACWRRDVVGVRRVRKNNVILFYMARS